MSLILLPSQSFSDKIAIERRFYTIDFVDDLAGATIVSGQTVTIRTVSGDDLNPSVMLDLSPITQGTIIGQWIKGGVPGCNYVVTFSFIASDTRDMACEAQLFVMP